MESRFPVTSRQKYRSCSTQKTGGTENRYAAARNIKQWQTLYDTAVKGRYFKKAMKKAENELREKLEDSIIGVERLKIEANENRLSINASLNLMESNEDGAAYFCEDEFSFLREIPSADIETWDFRAESCYNFVEKNP